MGQPLLYLTRLGSEKIVKDDHDSHDKEDLVCPVGLLGERVHLQALAQVLCYTESSSHT